MLGLPCRAGARVDLSGHLEIPHYESEASVGLTLSGSNNWAQSPSRAWTFGLASSIVPDRSYDLLTAPSVPRASKLAADFRREKY